MSKTYYDEFRPWGIPEETAFYNQPEVVEERKVIGECVFCHKNIYSTDNEWLLHDDSEKGICKECLNKCTWNY